MGHVEARKKSESPDWRSLDTRKGRPWLRIVGMGLVGFLCLVALGLESWCPEVRHWLVAHPAAVAVGTGLAVLLVGALGLEPLLRHSETRHWRQPALLVVDTYVFAADRVARRIRTRMVDIVDELPNPPSEHMSIARDLECLVEQAPERLAELSDYIREQTDELSVTAVLASSVIGRYGPYSEVVKDVFEQQRRLGELAEKVHGLGFISRGLDGPRGDIVAQLAAEEGEEAADLLEGVVHELHKLRLKVLEARQLEP